jgi:hypothetical protein
LAVVQVVVGVQAQLEQTQQITMVVMAVLD